MIMRLQMELAGKNKKMHRVQTSDFTERLEGGDTQTWFWCHQVEIEMDSKVHNTMSKLKGKWHVWFIGQPLYLSVLFLQTH